MKAECIHHDTDEVANLAKAIARRLLTVERILMGVIFVACGLNGLFNILPQSVSHDGIAMGGALMKTCWLFPMLKGTEVLLEQYVNGRK